ncbi:MAG: pilin [Patescibacteria group bacterium]|jgi:hypothetical protein
MTKKFWKVIGLLSVMIFNVGLFMAEPARAVTFDANGDIINATNLPNPKGGPPEVVIRVIQWALGFLGLVAVIMVLWGGVTWMTSAGNEERVKKAKEVLKTAVIGLIIIMLSWAMVTFVFARIDAVT